MEINLKHLSYSSLDLFERCPRCWYLKYQQYYKFPSSPALEFGAALHDVVRDYHLTADRQEVPEEMVKFLDKYKFIYGHDDYDIVEEMFKLEIEHPDEPGKVLTNLKGEPILLWAKCDRIHKPNIHDLKTASKDYTKKDVDNNRQADLYIYSYFKYVGELPNKVIFDVMIKPKRNTTEEPKLRVHETDASLVRMKDGLRWLWDSYAKILDFYSVVGSMGELPVGHGDNCWNKDLMI